MAGFFDFLPRGLLQKPTQVSPEEIAQAMEWKKSLMSGYLGPQTELTDRQREADRQASWASGAGFNPQEIRDRGGLLGMASTPGTYDQAMMMGGLAPLGITAFHGSPHKFDSFKMEKIGTGEGAQAYGHGLYFAENPGTATAYQHNTARIMDKPLYKGMELSSVPGAEGNVAAQMQSDMRSGLSFDKARAQLADYLKKNMQTEELNVLSKMKPGDFSEYKHSGILYKVDLPDEQVAKFLDWDKPLSQQSESVRKAIETSGLRFPPNATGEQIHQAFGARAVSALDPSMRGNSGENQVAASEALRQLGIPGIRYLDQGSRAGGQGTSNFVVFSPEMVKILSRE